GYLWRARARVSLKRPAEALPDIETAIEKLPRNAFARRIQGSALEKLGRLPEAAAAYEAALQLAPRDSWAQGPLAHVRETLTAASDGPRRMPGLALIKGQLQ